MSSITAIVIFISSLTKVNNFTTVDKTNNHSSIWDSSSRICRGAMWKTYGATREDIAQLPVVHAHTQGNPTFGHYGWLRMRTQSLPLRAASGHVTDVTSGHVISGDLTSCHVTSGSSTSLHRKCDLSSPLIQLTTFVLKSEKNTKYGVRNSGLLARNIHNVHCLLNLFSSCHEWLRYFCCDLLTLISNDDYLFLQKSMTISYDFCPISYYT